MAVDRAVQPTFRESHLRFWRNWHETFQQPIKKLLDAWNGEPDESTLEGYKATTEGLLRLIAAAVVYKDELRALGGGWSWSPVAATAGVLLNTKPLNFKFQLTRSVLHEDCPFAPDNLLFAQCGNSIAELNWYLFSKNKSLRTSGASNGQTIAGAVSTGTHGAALDVGAVQDSVVAIHLVTSPDRHVWLERESHPVATDRFIKDLGAEVCRDDKMFEAALVSFGSFGIIHGLVTQVENLFYLRAYAKGMKPKPPLKKVLTTLDFRELELPGKNKRPYHFQVIVNPFDPDDDWHVSVMYKDAKPDISLPLPQLSRYSVGEDALSVMSTLTDRVGRISSILGQGFFKFGNRDIEGECGVLGQTFNDTGTRGPSASMAMGIPLGKARLALDAVLDLHKETQAPVLVAMRFVKSTKATLGFTRFSPQTCVLEIDGPKSRRVLKFYRKVWKGLEDRDIRYTLHWGKMNFGLTPKRVRRAYGDESVEEWLRVRRELLPSRDLRRTFANDFLRKLELAH